MRCERCGAEVSEGVTVCSQCGYFIGAGDPKRKGRRARHFREDVGEAPAAPEAPVVPRSLADDPVSGDGSAGRPGVEVAAWRIKTLTKDQLGDVTEPGSTEREVRRIRVAHERSRAARTERGRSQRLRRRMVVALLVLLAVVGVGAAGITYVMELWGGRTVPEVIGISEGNARGLLEAKDFVVAVASEPSDALEGLVVRVDPPEGTRVDEGSTVSLTIAEPRYLPNVVGLVEDEALLALEEAGAKNVRCVSRLSFEPDGTVIETRPAADAVFISTDEIVVYVSQPPRMPDVVGEQVDVALARMDREEIASQVVYERGSVDDRLRVLRSEPAASKPVGEQGATLVVGDPLVGLLRLADYFDTTAVRIRDFVTGEGLEEKAAHLTQDGHAIVRFDDDKGSYLALAKDPWSHAVATDKEVAADAIDDSTKVEGLRLSVPIVRAVYEKAEQSPSDQDGQAQGGEENKDAAKDDSAKERLVEPAHAASLLTLSDPKVDEATAREVMHACGFGDEILGSCTPETIKLPEGTQGKGHAFFCCFGEVENRVWTVLIRGSLDRGEPEATEVVATCAPRSTYATIDLSSFGGKVCDYVAYQDEYAK